MLVVNPATDVAVTIAHASGVFPLCRDSAASTPGQRSAPVDSVPDALAQLSDSDLMGRMALNDQGAFNALVVRHFQRTYALAFRLVQSPSDAEDLTQEIFLTVWCKRGEWKDGGAKFSTWLYRVTFNRCIDFKRRAKNADMDEIPDIQDDRPSAVRLIERSEANQKLRQAMLKLSYPQQVALALFYQEGLSAMEASEVLDISVNALESLLKRARKRLRELLKSSSQELLEATKD